MEIGRIYIHAAVRSLLLLMLSGRQATNTESTSQIMELTLMRALHRTSATDKLDGPPMFKCGISHDIALALARDLDVPLNDLIWDQA